MTRCLVNDCPKDERVKRGMCNNHYQRYRLGTLDVTPAPRRQARDNWEAVQMYVQPTGFCWYWTGNLDGKGYGRFLVGGKQSRAHRWMYEYLVGPIPDGLEIDHLCRNKKCVNPDHLEPVTKSENQKRGRAGRLMTDERREQIKAVAKMSRKR